MGKKNFDRVTIQVPFSTFIFELEDFGFPSPTFLIRIEERRKEEGEKNRNHASMG